MLNTLNGPQSTAQAIPVPVDDDVQAAQELTSHLSARMDLLRRKRAILDGAIDELQKQIDAIGGPRPATPDVGWAGR